jgi:hypothetical protein
MVTVRSRKVVVFSLLALLALGAMAFTGLWHPKAPAEAMRMYLPQITLPAVVVAGLVDGINPCAFTVLLLFITAMTSSLGTGEGSAKAIRARLMGMGSIYIEGDAAGADYRRLPDRLVHRSLQRRHLSRGIEHARSAAHAVAGLQLPDLVQHGFHHATRRHPSRRLGPSKPEPNRALEPAS